MAFQSLSSKGIKPAGAPAAGGGGGNLFNRPTPSSSLPGTHALSNIYDSAVNSFGHAWSWFTANESVPSRNIELGVGKLMGIDKAGKQGFSWNPNMDISGSDIVEKAVQDVSRAIGLPADQSKWYYKVPEFAGGLAIDIAGDPFMYLGLGESGKAGTVFRDGERLGVLSEKGLDALRGIVGSKDLSQVPADVLERGKTRIADLFDKGATHLIDQGGLKFYYPKGLKIVKPFGVPVPLPKTDSVSAIRGKTVAHLFARAKDSQMWNFIADSAPARNLWDFAKTIFDPKHILGKGDLPQEVFDGYHKMLLDNSLAPRQAAQESLSFLGRDWTENEKQTLFDVSNEGLPSPDGTITSAKELAGKSLKELQELAPQLPLKITAAYHKYLNEWRPKYDQLAAELGGPKSKLDDYIRNIYPNLSDWRSLGTPKPLKIRRPPSFTQRLSDEEFYGGFLKSLGYSDEEIRTELTSLDKFSLRELANVARDSRGLARDPHLSLAQEAAELNIKKNISDFITATGEKYGRKIKPEEVDAYRRAGYGVYYPKSNLRFYPLAEGKGAGEARTYYHGTSKGEEISAKGFEGGWLTPDKNIAARYGNIVESKVPDSALIDANTIKGGLTAENMAKLAKDNPDKFGVIDRSPSGNPNEDLVRPFSGRKASDFHNQAPKTDKGVGVARSSAYAFENPAIQKFLDQFGNSASSMGPLINSLTAGSRRLVNVYFFHPASAFYHSPHNVLFNSWLAGGIDAFDGLSGAAKEVVAKGKNFQEAAANGVFRRMEQGLVMKDVLEEELGAAKARTLKDTLNLFNPFSYNHIGNKLFYGGDDVLRMNLYLTAKKKGAGAAEAADFVHHWAGNYKDLTETEKSIFRLLYPYYSWFKTNVKANFGAWANLPERQLVPLKVWNVLNEALAGHPLWRNQAGGGWKIATGQKDKNGREIYVDPSTSSKIVEELMSDPERTLTARMFGGPLPNFLSALTTGKSAFDNIYGITPVEAMPGAPPSAKADAFLQMMLPYEMQRAVGSNSSLWDQYWGWDPSHPQWRNILDSLFQFYTSSPLTEQSIQSIDQRNYLLYLRKKFKQAQTQK